MGNIGTGRPGLGNVTAVTACRLFRFSLRHVLEERLGVGGADELLRSAGSLAGKEFAAPQLDRGKGLEAYLDDVASKMCDLKIGMLKTEKVGLSGSKFILGVSEDLDCSGVPINGGPMCSFDEGFIYGIFKRFAGSAFEVKKAARWSTGAKVCRFLVQPARWSCRGRS